MKILIAFRRAIIWAACILGLLIMHPGRLPKIEINWTIGPDKLVHFFLFAVLSYFLIEGIKSLRYNRNYFWLAGIGSSFYGVLMEYLQGAYFTFRSFDYADMIANAIGALSLSLYLWLRSE